MRGCRNMVREIITRRKKLCGNIKYKERQNIRVKI